MSIIPDNDTKKATAILQDLICNNPLTRYDLDESIHEVIDHNDIEE